MELTHTMVGFAPDPNVSSVSNDKMSSGFEISGIMLTHSSKYFWSPLVLLIESIRRSCHKRIAMSSCASNIIPLIFDFQSKRPIILSFFKISKQSNPIVCNTSLPSKKSRRQRFIRAVMIKRNQYVVQC